jgi:hypothetical protein
MRRLELESWVLQVADRVNAHQPVEDGRVELKAEWPDDPYRAARRLAGHCNAALGEPALWIIGLDEERGVLGAEDTELADWLAQVRGHFADMSPALLTDINVPIEDRTLVALLFETDRAPYLVRVPGGGAVQTEVPWRDGTAVRSARREDLIRLLIPIQRLPSAKILGALLTRTRVAGSPAYVDWSLSVDVYVVPLNKEPIVIPVHECAAYVDIAPGGSSLRLDNIHLGPQLRPLSATNSPVFPVDRNLSHTVRSTPSEVIINGPGLVCVSASAQAEDDGIDDAHFVLDTVLYRLVLVPVHAGRHLRLDGALLRLREKLRPDQGDAEWVMRRDAPIRSSVEQTQGGFDPQLERG